MIVVNNLTPANVCYEVNTTCSCMDSKYYQYLFKNLQNCGLEIRGMGIYNEIQILKKSNKNV